MFDNGYLSSCYSDSVSGIDSNSANKRQDLVQYHVVTDIIAEDSNRDSIYKGGKYIDGTE